MYTEKQLGRMLEKLIRFEKTLDGLLFEKQGEVEVRKYQTLQSFDRIPDDSLFEACKKGDPWGGEGVYCWYKGSYTVPEELDGKELFVWPKAGGYECMLWADGVPHGIFTGHSGNHYSDRIREKAKAGEVIELAFEFYAHHFVIGTMPFQHDEMEFHGKPRETYQFTYDSIDICTRNEEIMDFYFDLKVINQMAKYLPKDNFRRADLVRTLIQVHEIVYYDYENVDRETFYEAIRKAAPLLKAQLAKKNSESAPYVGLIGHSHMDTAWLWHQGETLKKCARTYSNEINLMERYPEYTFVQSSAYHSEMIKEHYPALFEQIKKYVKEGRYEPNGGVYIECDCNIPSGEYVIRQFVLGQQFTQENFDYRSDAFWLPDTFGYSAALPQILQGCGIKYFLTTKLSWNDTNNFPYDTFYWKGLDGSRVLVHFNKSHLWPDPRSLSYFVLEDNGESIQEKTVTDRKLFSYGFGDGGGGPEFGMIEMTRRLRDVEGMPKTEHTTVSRFMKELEESIVRPSTYSGELYLELHRGTLTNQHTIKRNNRLAEIALHNLEYVSVRNAMEKQEGADPKKIRPLLSVLLKNQFHDILPGTCIPRAHDEAKAEVSEVIKEAVGRTQEILAPARQPHVVTAINTLSFERNDVLYLDYEEGYVAEGGYRQQIITDLEGKKKLAVAGVTIPAFGSSVLRLVPGEIPDGSAFLLEGNVLNAPLEKLTFNEKGYIDSYIDLEEERELRGDGYALNTFLIGEEVSLIYDNWDIDADAMDKLKDTAVLLEREVVSDGAVEYRIRSKYQLSAKSTLLQDMIVYADSKEVKFETKMDWQDEHRLLKTAFDTSVFADTARHEVQFGYIKRPTTRNTDVEKAKFEVSNHKYTDLSEMRYGVALLNDCKYGISVEESKMHLSLHKGGNRPDYRGDKGEHFCSYAFLPHKGEFSAANVIRPAYVFNYKPVLANAEVCFDSLLTVETDNVIAETVKPVESGERAFVVRLYEAEGARSRAKVSIHADVKSVEATNMLEEAGNVIAETGELTLTFRPFEIKTLKIKY